MCVRNAISALRKRQVADALVQTIRHRQGEDRPRANLNPDAREFNLADRARQSRKIRWLGTEEEPQLVDDRGS